MKNKTALVTGGSQGIGLAITAKLIAAGCNVVVLSRTKGELESIDAMKADGKPTGVVVWKKCDVSDSARVSAIMDELAQEGRSIDILVNNTGIALGAPHSFWEQSLADIHQMIGANILGLINVTHAVLRAFLVPANAGTILNISSVTGLEVPKKEMGETIYHSSKAFLEGFSETLRNETIGTDIRILVLRPGFVRTHFHFQRIGEDQERFEKIFAGIEELSADDVAQAALTMLNQPERISIKALDIVPTAQRSLSVVDRQWNARHGK